MADDFAAAAAIKYVATCDDCLWEGKPRVSNLAALGDFDAHKASAGHAEQAAMLARLARDPGDYETEDDYQAALIEARRDAYEGGAIAG